jgi:hypothetical protein
MVDSWDDYNWDDATGVATFTRDDPSKSEPVVVARLSQPTRSGHRDWATEGWRPQKVLTLQ